MNRRTTLAVLVLAVITAFVSINRAENTPSPNPIKWEYAWLVTDVDKTIWQDSQRQLNEDGPDHDSKLAKDLANVQFSPNRGTRVQVLNAIGSQGWELLAVEDTGHTFYFKRPAR